jgi:hypothetical protein
MGADSFSRGFLSSGTVDIVAAQTQAEDSGFPPVNSV